MKHRCVKPAKCFPFLLACLWLLAGCSSLAGGQSPTPTPVPAAAISASPTFTVQRGEITRELRFRGHVVPITMQGLFFRSSGYVRSVYVRRNDPVKAGQVLADLEIGDLEKQLAQAQIAQKVSENQLTAAQQAAADALAEAQIALKIEQLRLEEAQYNLKQNGGTLQQIAVQIQQEQVKLAELQVARLQRGADPQLSQAVDLARLEVERLQAQIADSSLTAPFDGQVLELNVQPGDSVTAFDRAVLTLCDPTQLEISARLDSTEFEALAEGMTVAVQFGGATRPALPGVVRSLPYPYGSGAPADAANPTGEQGSSARITLQAGPAEGGYQMGDLGEVQVILEQKLDVLWLPPEAIRNFEGRKFVVVQEGDAQKRVNVTLGIATDRRVEILEGLQEGQIVVGQ